LCFKEWKIVQSNTTFYILSPTNSASHYITGIVGDWKHHFTVAQSEEMDRLIAEHFKGNIVETLSNVTSM